MPTGPFEARFARFGATPVPDPAGPARLSSRVMSILPGSRLAQAVLRGFLLPVVLVPFSVRGGMSCSRAGSRWLCEDDFEGHVCPSEVSS